MTEGSRARLAGILTDGATPSPVENDNSSVACDESIDVPGGARNVNETWRTDSVKSVDS